MKNTNIIAVLWGTWVRFEETDPDGGNFFERCDSVEYTDDAIPVSAILLHPDSFDEIDNEAYERVDYPTEWPEGYAVLEVSQATYEVSSDITTFDLVKMGPGTSIRVGDEIIESDDWDVMEMEEVIDVKTGRSLGYDELW